VLQQTCDHERIIANLRNGLIDLSHKLFVGPEQDHEESVQNVLVGVLETHTDLPAFLQCQTRIPEKRTQRAAFISDNLADKLPLLAVHQLFDELGRGVECERSRVRRALARAPEQFQDFMAEILPANLVPTELEIAEAIQVGLKTVSCSATEFAFINLFINHGIREAHALCLKLEVNPTQLSRLKWRVMQKLKSIATLRESLYESDRENAHPRLRTTFERDYDHL